MISFPKLSKTLFAFIHTLCTGLLLPALVIFCCGHSFLTDPSPLTPPPPPPPAVHTKLTISLDSASFTFILAALQEGLAGPSGQFKRAAWDTGVSTDCANALDGLLSWRLRATPRDAGECHVYFCQPTSLVAEFFAGVVAAFNAHIGAIPK